MRVRVIPSVTPTTQFARPAGPVFGPANIYLVTASTGCTMFYHQTKFSFPIFFVRLVTTPLFLANSTSLATCGKCNIAIDLMDSITCEWAPDPNGYQGCNTAYFRWLALHHPDILKRWKRDDNKIGRIRAEAHFSTWAANRTIDYLHRMQGTRQPFFGCMSVFDPHSPYTNYPEEYRDLLDIGALPGIHAPDDSFDHRPIDKRSTKRICLICSKAESVTRPQSPSLMSKWGAY